MKKALLSSQKNCAIAENPVNRVSKKFYNGIIDRINAVFNELPQGEDLKSKTVEMINHYINEGVVSPSDNKLVSVAFLMLKSEIDKAAVRSRRAREAATRRKESKQSFDTLRDQIPQEKSVPEVQTLSEATNIHSDPCHKSKKKNLHRRKKRKHPRHR